MAMKKRLANSGDKALDRRLANYRQEYETNERTIDDALWNAAGTVATVSGQKHAEQTTRG